MNNRKKHIDKFYDLLEELENIEPKRTLNNCTGRMKWPEQGVYFFFEVGELRENKKPSVSLLRLDHLG